MAKKKSDGVARYFEGIVGSGPGGRETARAGAKTPYLRRTFYVTEAQYRAMRLLAANSDGLKDRDLSSIVRAALDAYLGGREG